MQSNPEIPLALPPETRQLVTYEEGAAWWSAHVRPMAARSLRRIPLKTRMLGRNRLIEFKSLREAAAAELSAAPSVLFHSPRRAAVKRAIPHE